MVNFVIAKYKENMDWTKSISNHHKVTIYNKSHEIIESSIQLKNKGREGETFLYHIVNNYDKLDDVTVFLQGDPFAHLQILVGWRDKLTDNEFKEVINKMNNEIDDNSKFSSFYQVMYNVYNFTNGVDTNKACREYYGEEHNTFTVSPGAQYIVPKECILARPLSFWKKLHMDMFSEKLNGYCQEQLWYLAFTGKMNGNFGGHDIEKYRCLSNFSLKHTPYSYYSY